MVCAFFIFYFRPFMKKSLLLLLCMFTLSGWAYDAIIDGIYYNLNKTANTATVTYLSSSGTVSYKNDIVIPTTITYKNDVYNVTAIGSNAFMNCTKLTSIIIQAGVTSIGEQAFKTCTSLESVTLPEGITTIGRYAFQDCSALQSIIIPDGVTEIKSYTFSGCQSLKSITIPKTITKIDYESFSNCSGLENVYIFDLSSFCKIDFYYAYHSYSTPFRYAHHLYLNNEEVTDLIIPDDITSIPPKLFISCYSFQSVTIPESVTTIGEHAFQGCLNLKTANIPQSVTSIGTWIFQGCSSLTSLAINCPIIEEEIGRLESVKELTIGNTVTTIGEKAFYGFSGITTLKIPSSVKTIQDNAFIGCTSLEELTIEDSQDVLNCGNNGTKTSPGSYTVSYLGLFSDSPLKKLYLGRNISYALSDTDWYWNSYSPFRNKRTITSVTFGESVTRINSGEFYGCSALTSIEIPEKVTKIGDCAFKDCSKLNEILLPTGLLEFGHRAFEYCGFTSFVIPENITTIGERGFYGCWKLSSVQIAKGITIGSDAFGDCSNLSAIYTPSIEDWTQINFTDANANPLTSAKALYIGNELVTTLSLSDKVKTVGKYAFYGYDKLTSLNISNGVESIGTHAFDGCSGLTKLLIPNSIKNIGAGAFANCLSLYSITSLINIPFKLDESVFQLTSSSYDTNTIYYAATLYVPRGRKAFYGQIDGWKTFLNVEEIDTKYTITYILDGETYKTYEIQAGEVVTPEPDPYKEGYDFSGWSTIPWVMPAENVVVTGSFTPGTGLTDISSDSAAKSFINYDLSGRKLQSFKRGLNIIQNGGTTKKVFR